MHIHVYLTIAEESINVVIINISCSPATVVRDKEGKRNCM